MTRPSTHIFRLLKWGRTLARHGAMRGIEAFNRGEYFDQHEYFEEAWLAEERPVREMYQGILQVGVAFLQIERKNWSGAIKTFRRGLPRLRLLPDTCQGIDIAAFRRTAEAIHLEVTQLGPDRLDEFDQGRFPTIACPPKPRRSLLLLLGHA